MIGASVEQSMRNNHRGVRERLGMPLRSGRRVALSVPVPPPVIVYSYLPVYPEPQRPIDPLDESQSQVNIRWKRIVREVCIKHNLRVEEIRAHRRNKLVIMARREAMYRLRYETLMSLPEIGRKMGGFDHSSVHHSIGKHEAFLRATAEGAAP